MSVAQPQVLVVSESRITRRVVEMTFADQPLQVVVASSSAQALDDFRARPSSIVIADISMQPPDGYGLARELRAHPAGADTVLILLAAQAATVDDTAVMEHRVSSVLRKPLDSHQLLDALRDALRVGAPRSTAVAATAIVSEPPPHLPASDAPSADGVRLAETFHALLDAEQGMRPAFAPELTDDEVDRIAGRVVAILSADADRTARIDGVIHERTEAITTVAASAAAERMVPTVAAGVAERMVPSVAADVAERVVRELTPRLVEQVARLMVADVSERLVRDEIARLRATRLSA